MVRRWTGATMPRSCRRSGYVRVHREAAAGPGRETPAPDLGDRDPSEGAGQVPFGPRVGAGQVVVGRVTKRGPVVEANLVTAASIVGGEAGHQAGTRGHRHRICGSARGLRAGRWRWCEWRTRLHSSESRCSEERPPALRFGVGGPDTWGRLLVSGRCQVNPNRSDGDAWLSGPYVRPGFTVPISCLTWLYPGSILPLPCLYPASTLPLPCLYPASTLPLPYLYPASTLPLPCLYPASTLPLRSDSSLATHPGRFAEPQRWGCGQGARRRAV